MVSADQQRVSDQIVRLVQVFFALVLGQSLLLYRNVLLHPLAREHWLATLACVTMFYTTVASWVDWHVVMVRRPYNTRERFDRFRIYSDVAVVVLYAYLLFTIEPLIGDPAASLLPAHLAGYPAVFVLYLISGLLRLWVHGRGASKPMPIVLALIAYAALYFRHHFDRHDSLRLGGR